MAEVLVLVEQSEGAVKKVTAELITAARALGEPSAVVVGAPGTAAGLIEDLKAAGAAKIYVAESADVDNVLVTPYVDVLANLAESSAPAAVLVAANADGKEIAGGPGRRRRRAGQRGGPGTGRDCHQNHLARARRRR